MPQCDFVAKFGPDYFDVSMKVLDEMTQRFTAEGGIRPFIQKYPEQTLQRLEQWRVIQVLQRGGWFQKTHGPGCLSRRDCRSLSKTLIRLLSDG
jgi:hypothetical protein